MEDWESRDPEAPDTSGFIFDTSPQTAVAPAPVPNDYSWEEVDPAVPTQDETRQRLLHEDWIFNRNQEKPTLNILDHAALGVGQALEGLKRQGYGLVDAAAPTQGVADWASKGAKESAKEAQNIADLETQDSKINPADRFASWLTENITSMLPLVLGGLGGGTGAAVAGGLQTFGSTFEDAKDAYKAQNPDWTEQQAKNKAYIPASIAGAISGLIFSKYGNVGMSAIKNGLTAGGVNEIVANVLHHAAIGASQMAVNQFGQELVQKFSYNPEKPVSEMVKETLLAGAGGGLLSGLMVGTKEVLGRAFMPSPPQPPLPTGANLQVGQIQSPPRSAISAARGRSLPPGSNNQVPLPPAMDRSIQPPAGPGLKAVVPDLPGQPLIDPTTGKPETAIQQAPDPSDKPATIQYLLDQADIIRQGGNDVGANQLVDAARKINDSINPPSISRAARNKPAEASQPVEPTPVAPAVETPPVAQAEAVPTQPAPVAVWPNEVANPGSNPWIDLNTKKVAGEDALAQARNAYYDFQRQSHADDDASVKSFFKQSDELRKRIIDLEWEKAKNADVVQLGNGDLKTIVHPSTREPGKWQATRYGADGIANGDSTFDTKEQAVKSWLGDSDSGAANPPWGSLNYSVIKTKQKMASATPEPIKPAVVPEVPAVAPAQEPTVPPSISKAPKVPQTREKYEYGPTVQFVMGKFGKIYSYPEGLKEQKFFNHDNFRALKRSLPKMFSPTGRPLDIVVDAMRREGLVGDSAPLDEGIDALIKDAAFKKAQRSQATKENRKLNEMGKQAEAEGLIDDAKREAFEAKAFRNKRNVVEKKKTPGNDTSELSLGDTFTINKEPFKVVAIENDIETGKPSIVRLEGGKNYGNRTINLNDPAQAQIFVDGGVIHHVEEADSSDFLPEKPVVKNPKGQDLILYHGSPSSFESFSPEHFRNAGGSGNAEHGFYFTNDYESAHSYTLAGKSALHKSIEAVNEQYATGKISQAEANQAIKKLRDAQSKLKDVADASNVYRAKLKAEKIYEATPEQTQDEAIQAAKAGGYDAVHIKDVVDNYHEAVGSEYDKKVDVWIVFSPKQIEIVPFSKLPKLLNRDQGQGDLLNNQSEDLNLVPEQGVDHAKAAQEKLDAEQRAAEAKAIADKQQLDIQFSGNKNKNYLNSPFDEEPLGYARGIKGITYLIHKSKIPDDAKNLILGLLQEPVFQKGDWSQLEVALLENLKSGAEGEYLGNLIRMIRTADPAVFGKEMYHHMFRWLPEAEQMALENERLAELKRQFGEKPIPPELLDGTMTSTQFQKAGLPDHLYPLINASEFLSEFMGERYKQDHMPDPDKPFLKQLWDKIREMLQAFIQAVKRVFGPSNPIPIPESARERIAKDLLAGKYEARPLAGGDYEMEASYPYNAKDAANAAKLSIDPHSKEENAMHQSVAANDIVDVLIKHGASALSNAAKTALDFYDWLGIAESGQRLNSGVKEGYRAFKAKLAAMLPPEQAKYQLNWNSRFLGAKLAKFNHLLDNVIKTGQEALQEMMSPAIMNLTAKVSQARMTLLNAQAVNASTVHLFDAALKKAYAALEVESQNDAKLEHLKSKIDELQAAQTSSAAMQQLLEDIIDKLNYSGNGKQMLADPNFGTRTDIMDEYRSVKQQINEPLHNPNLLNWAAFILQRDKKLKDQLYAAYLYNNMSGITAGMSGYEQKFFADMKKDPVGTLRRELSLRDKTITGLEKARFTWMQLNDELLTKLDELNASVDAGTVATAIKNDADLKGLYTEVRNDVGKIGDQKPFFPFTEDSMLLPSGNVLDLNPRRITGSKTEFMALRPHYEAGINELRSWLQANPDHQNYRTHELNLRNLEDYFYPLSMLQPNDPLFLWKHSFYIMNNAVLQAGGRLAQSAKRAVAIWDRTKDNASNWNQKWSHILSKSRMEAMKSHGYDWSDLSGASIVDSNQKWRDAIGNHLASSWARARGGLKVGDMLPSGETVTREDLADLKTQADATSEGYKVAEKEGLNFGADALDDVVTYRKLQKTSDYMVNRKYNFLLNSTIGLPIHMTRDKFYTALKAKDRPGMDAARQQMRNFLNRQSVWGTIGKYLVADRHEDFAKATTFDGAQGALTALKPVAHQITSFDDLVSRLSQMSAVPEADVRNEMLAEYARIIDQWYLASKKDLAGVAGGGTLTPEHTSNQFSTTRGKELAPSVFYEYGFADTTRSTGSFANGIHKRALDTVRAALQAVAGDLDRQMGDFAMAKRVTPEKVLLTENARQRAAGETYDNWKDLEKRKAFITKILSELTESEKMDAEGDVAIGRLIGAVTSSLITGTGVAVRNIISSAPILAHTMRAMTGSAIKSYPAAAWHVFVVEQAKAIYTVAMSLAKATFKFAIPDFFGAVVKAIQGKSRPGHFLNEAAHRFIDEMSTSMIERMASWKKLSDAGILFNPDLGLELQNRLLGSALSAGKIGNRSYTLGEKARLLPASIIEMMILPFRGLNPKIGDIGLNSAGATLTHYAIDGWAKRVASIYEESKRTGYRAFDLTNPGNPDNLISAKEFFPNSKDPLTDYTQMRSEFDKSGIDFSAAAIRYMQAIEAHQNAGGPAPRMFTDVEREHLLTNTINAINKSSPANSPLILKRNNFIMHIVKPFMGWPTRQLSNFINRLQIAGNLGVNVTAKKLAQMQAVKWAVLSTAVILPTLAMLAFSGAFTEQEMRAVKSILYNQVTASRQPWEREKASEQARAWITTAASGIPFVNMAMTAMFNDLPNRASAVPELAIIQKVKEAAQYVGGVIQTGDMTYRLPEFIGNLFPDSKIILNRLESQEGKRDLSNEVALLRRFGDTDLLRPMGQVNGVNATPLTPYGAIIANAIMSGDQGKIKEAFDEAVAKATEMGIQNPEQRVRQLALARSPYNSAFNTKLTADQREELLSRMPAGDRAAVENAEQKFTDAAQTLGGHISFSKVPSRESGGGLSVSTASVTGVPSVSRASRTSGLRLSNSISTLASRSGRKIRSSGRIGLSHRNTRLRIGLNKRTRRF